MMNNAVFAARAGATRGSENGLVTSPPTLVNANVDRKRTLGEVLSHASHKALAGGLPGAAAMAVQVGSLMWLRTTIQYQYKHGTSTMTAFRNLYAQGGIPRFYAGVGPALIQGPLSRFGDTAANAGCLALLEDVPIQPWIKTVAASASAGAFRIFLMPIDTAKTIMQVEGNKGWGSLMQKLKVGGPAVLYHGSMASAAATFVGHYPWFATYNTLDGYLAKYGRDEMHKRLLRSALIGFCSSFVSDLCSNSIRVVKTSKQASTVPVTYLDVTREIIAKDGVLGLMGRGLGTKLLSNGVQGVMFSVLWRLGQDAFEKREIEIQASKQAELQAKTISSASQ